MMPAFLNALDFKEKRDLDIIMRGVMTTETQDFAEFLRQPIVIKYLDEIGRDAQIAIDTAKRNLAYRGMTHYPARMVTNYKTDLKSLISSEGKFNAEYTRVGSGAARSLDAFSKTYHTYMLNLEILEIQNGDHSALIDANLASQIAALFVILNEMSPLGVQYKLLNDKTNNLIKSLQDAHRACRDKALMAAINVPLKILATVVCPQRALVRLAWRGGLTATQSVVEAVITSGDGGREFLAAKSAGSLGLELATNLKRTEPTILNSLGAASVTIVTNGVGVGLEMAKVKKLDAEIKAYMKLFKSVAKEFGKQTSKISSLQISADRALVQAARNLGSASPSTARRSKLIAEIKSWNR